MDNPFGLTEAEMDEQLDKMAADPDIQRELAQIQEDFQYTDMEDTQIQAYFASPDLLLEQSETKADDMNLTNPNELSSVQQQGNRS